MLNFLKALSVLLGTIIGAGIFGIPYIIGKSGIIPGFFYFLILGGVVLLIHLFFGEVVLRTKESCRLPGFSQKYLGSLGRFLVMISVVSGLVGALLAYLILGGELLKILFSPFLDLSVSQLTVFFWAVLSYFIFRGMKLIASAELFTNLIFFLVSAVILFFCLPKFDLHNINALNVPSIFLPFGIILFSLIGWSAIPEITDILKAPRERKGLRRTIILATAIVVPFYLIFTLVVVGVAGKGVSQDTLSGLVPFLGPKVILFGALAALITLADSFLVLGLHLKNTFIYDLKLPKGLAAVITCGLPLILFLMGFRSFIATVGLVGTIVGVIEGTAIILIFKRVKKMGNRKPEYSLKVPSSLLYFLIAVLILGAISQFLI